MKILFGSSGIIAYYFVRIIKVSYLNAEQDLSEIPRAQRRGIVKPLSEYAENYIRNEAIANAYASGGYSMKEIGDYFGLHYSTISGIINNHSSKT